MKVNGEEINGEIAAPQLAPRQHQRDAPRQYDLYQLEVSLNRLETERRHRDRSHGHQGDAGQDRAAGQRSQGGQLFDEAWPASGRGRAHVHDLNPGGQPLLKSRCFYYRAANCWMSNILAAAAAAKIAGLRWRS